MACTASIDWCGARWWPMLLPPPPPPPSPPQAFLPLSSSSSCCTALIKPSIGCSLDIDFDFPWRPCCRRLLLGVPGRLAWLPRLTLPRLMLQTSNNPVLAFCNISGKYSELVELEEDARLLLLPFLLTLVLAVEALDEVMEEERMREEEEEEGEGVTARRRLAGQGQKSSPS